MITNIVFKIDLCLIPIKPAIYSTNYGVKVGVVIKDNPMKSKYHPYWTVIIPSKQPNSRDWLIIIAIKYIGICMQ